MKHPGPYQKIAMDRQPFMLISTGKRMASANETTKRVRIILRGYQTRREMGEKEKVLVHDNPGRLAQTARGFSISVALASGRVSVGGAQGGLAWVWMCINSIGTNIIQ